VKREKKLEWESVDEKVLFPRGYLLGWSRWEGQLGSHLKYSGSRKMGEPVNQEDGKPS
jgi:hypothetical protein